MQNGQGAAERSTKTSMQSPTDSEQPFSTDRPGSSPTQPAWATGSDPPPQFGSFPAAQDSQASFMPIGMDREAFVAGERAAMARSLQMMLPSQQALGALGNGLQHLEARMQEESQVARQVALASADARSMAQAVNERLNHLEHNRLHDMDARIQRAIDAPLSQEFTATLAGLRTALDSAGSRSPGPYSITGFVVRQLANLGATASLYAQQAISKADVAAIFLSRKILLDAPVIRQIRDNQAEEGERITMPASSTAVCGAAFFLAAVETAWQMHSRALRLVPSRVRKATVPAQMGLRVMRVATWAATITLSAIYLRRVCYLMADTSINAMDRCIKSMLKVIPPRKPAPSASLQHPSKTNEDPDRERDGSAAGSHTSGDQPSPISVNEPQSPQKSSLLPGPQALHRQRSIFDTPPPSPPP